MMYSCLVVSLTRAGEITESVAVASGTVADPAFIETEISPKDGVAGQKRILQVRLYTKSWLRKAPRYPDLLVDGAVVLTPSAFGVNSTAERNGEQYTVQTKEYQLFPKRSGAFIVPPFSLNFSIAGQDGVSLISTELQSDNIGFKVSPLESNQMVLDDESTNDIRASELVGRELELEQSWALLADDKPLRAGDAYGREIKLSLNDSLAMFIPPFNQFMPVFSKSTNGDSYRIEGGNAFQALEKVDDISNRGDSVAIRVERWHYVFEAPGLYKLPDVTLYWWDLASEQWNIEVAEGKEIEVLPSLLSEGGTSSSSYKLSSVTLFIVFAVMMALMLLAIFNRVSFIKALKACYNYSAAAIKNILQRMGFPFDQMAFRGVERQRWSELERALDSNNEDQVATLLYQWIGTWRAHSMAAQLKKNTVPNKGLQNVREFYMDGNPEIPHDLEVLLSKHYQESGNLNSEDFDKLVVVCRTYRGQLHRTHRSNKYKPQGVIKNFNRDSICSRSLNP